MYKKFTLIAALLMVLAGTFFPAAAAAADGVTKITYWHYLSGDNEIHQKMVEEFNAAHPHIQVEMLYTGNQFVARDNCWQLSPEMHLRGSPGRPVLASAEVCRALVPLRNFVDPDEYLQDYSQVSKDTVTVFESLTPFS